MRKLNEEVDLTTDKRLYAIKVRRLESNLNRVRAQRDEANCRIIDLENDLNIQRENTRIAYDEVNRLRNIIQDFSESALGVLNDD